MSWLAGGATEPSLPAEEWHVVLPALERAGLVVMGHDGSPSLSQPSAAISVAAVLRAAGKEPGLELWCVRDCDGCPRRSECPVARLADRVQDVAAMILDNLSLAELALETF